MATIHFHPDLPTSLVPEAVATVREMIASGEGFRATRGLAFTVITLPDGWSAVEITEAKDSTTPPTRMEKAREALSDLLSDVVDTAQPDAVVALLTYDCDFTARDWRKLARLAQAQADEQAQDAADDRRTRRAENGWRDA